MVLQKENIWERLKTESTWVGVDVGEEDARIPLFAVVPERQFRYVVGIWISGNMQATRTIKFEKSLETDPVTYETKWSPIPVAPADFRQIPKGSLSITDPIVTFEGGTRLYGKTDVAGLSLNVTVEYWDWDI